MKIYQSVENIPNHEIKKGCLLTGFRPSTTKGHQESIGLTLGHLEQLEKIKKIQDQGCKQIFIIIADIQGLADKTSNQHGELVKKITYDYTKSIINYLGKDIILFRESKIRKEVSHLTDMIQDHIYINELKVYNKNGESKNFLIDRIQDQLNKGKNPSISNLITAYTGQAAHILGAKANLIPSGADEFTKTAIASKVIERLNKIYNIKLKEPIAIGGDKMLLGFDGERMSTNFGNYISTKDTKNDIKTKVNMMSQKTIEFYTRHYNLEKSSKKDLTEKIYKIINPLQKEINNSDIEQLLTKGEYIYKENIEKLINQITII